MALKLKIMTKEKLASLNQNLQELNLLYAECEKAEKAGVPGLEQAKQSCIDLHNKIAALKAAYFSQEL